jgi:hypothetical protein
MPASTATTVRKRNRLGIGQGLGEGLERAN